MSRAVAGHFDLYFCADRMPKKNAEPDHYAPILHDELMNCGIENEKAFLQERGREGWKQVFGQCAAGDLLILCLSPVEFEDARRFIEGYAGSDR